jgi:hypothetical protein
MTTKQESPRLTRYKVVNARLHATSCKAFLCAAISSITFRSTKSAVRMSRLVPMLLVALHFLVACSDNDSMNKIVQNGGTILISLGADQELGHAILSNTDLSSSIRDSAGRRVTVTVRQVFPLNVDVTSVLGRLETPTHRNGYSGFWFAVIDLLDRDTGLATDFEPGMAQLKIHGLASNIYRSVEILPGQGTVNPIMNYEGYDVLALLRPADQVKYVLSDPQQTFNESNLLGAIEFSFNYYFSDVSSLPRSNWPRAVLATNNEHLQILSYTESAEGINTLRVIVMNPAGIGHISDANGDAAEFYRASELETVRFSIVYPAEVGSLPFLSPTKFAGYGVDGAKQNVDTLVAATPAT